MMRRQCALVGETVSDVSMAIISTDEFPCALLWTPDWMLFDTWEKRPDEHRPYLCCITSQKIAPRYYAVLHVDNSRRRALTAVLSLINLLH
jgi:hypothetical protein